MGAAGVRRGHVGGRERNVPSGKGYCQSLTHEPVPITSNNLREPAALFSLRNNLINMSLVWPYTRNSVTYFQMLSKRICNIMSPATPKTDVVYQGHVRWIVYYWDTTVINCIAGRNGSTSTSSFLRKSYFVFNRGEQERTYASILGIRHTNTHTHGPQLTTGKPRCSHFIMTKNVWWVTVSLSACSQYTWANQITSTPPGGGKP